MPPGMYTIVQVTACHDGVESHLRQQNQFAVVQRIYSVYVRNYTCTVEPLYNGHIGTDHFVHYREVVLFQR